MERKYKEFYLGGHVQSEGDYTQNQHIPLSNNLNKLQLNESCTISNISCLGH